MFLAWLYRQNSWPVVTLAHQLPSTRTKHFVLPQVICNHELKQVVTVCSEPIIRVWEVDSGKQVHHVTNPHGEGQEVTALTFDPSGYRLATAAQDGNQEFHETCHSVTFYFMKKDSKRCCDTTMPESIHTKDESKRSSAFAFIFGVNWPVQWM